MSSSTESSQPRDRTQVSPTAGEFFTNWATREAQNIFYMYINLTSCYLIMKFFAIADQLNYSDTYIAPLYL